MSSRDVLRLVTPDREGHRSGATAAELSPRDELDPVVRAELAARFQIGQQLERGARSSLYAAREAAGGRRVSLRVIARASLADAGLEARIERAIAMAASLDHPNIVPILASGATAGLFWYTVEPVEGRSLAALLESGGALDLKSCLRIAEQAAGALHYAHRRSAVHGDLRPANLFVTGPGWVHLSDFVVTRLLNGPTAATAPEMTGGAEPSPAADQYALAHIVYECLAGAPPSEGDAHAAGFWDYPLPSRLAEARPDLPGHVLDALQRALSPRPAHRFPTVLDFVSALGAAEVGPPCAVPEARPPLAFGGPELLFVEAAPRLPRPHRRSLRAVAVVLVLAGAGEFGLERMRGVDPIALSPGAAPTAPAPAPAPARAPVAQPDSAAVEPPASNPAPEPAETVAQPAVDARTIPRGPVHRGKVKVPARQPATRRSTHPAAAPASARLSVSSSPWGLLYVDEQLVGNTPIVDFAVTPGTHRLRIVRDGYRSLNRQIRIARTERSRSLNLVLEATAP
jgi:pyruvate/2-oxoglutarate dehydrogenase complex dihydrolipoamide acyltransferase (E2) component